MLEVKELEVLELEDFGKPLFHLTKDLKEAVFMLGSDSIRYLVDTYYRIQMQRIRASNQVRTLAENEKPNIFVKWTADRFLELEKRIKALLDEWTDSQPLGVWCKSIKGIGSILAAGLMSYIDIEKAPTVGHIWRYAGLDPTITWEKGQKRPYNAKLKTICWKIGESFVKVKNSPEDIYGKVYEARKQYETEKNNNFEYAQQAYEILNKKNIGKDTIAYQYYSKGMLPPGHIHARARRYAVKLFLSHYHHVAYYLRYGQEPPLPYVLEHVPGHVHFIEPPNFDLVKELAEQMKK